LPYKAAKGLQARAQGFSIFLNECPMAHGFNKLYEFGPWRLDPQKLQLSRDGDAVPLPPKAAEILLVMLANSGQTVSKDDLMRSVWPHSFVEESNLTQNIFLLRKALGETAQQSSYIITIPGKGYRLAAAVRQVPHGDAAPAAESAIDLPVHPEETAVAARRWPLAPKLIWLWLLVPGLVVIGLAGAVALHRQHPPPPQAAPGRVMLAVLPFENLTGNAEQEYFSDGMTEEMTAQLGNLDPRHLGVISRTSVMHYKGSQEPLDQIGRELGVQYVLEGSVRRDAGKVRITAQLIQMKDQSHIWARQYDRELRSTLALQTEIAQDIAGEIQQALGADNFSFNPGPQPSTTSYEAYDLYLKGRYFWNKRSGEGFEQAIRYFQQAIDKDPGYARAYAGLADCYVLLPAFSGMPPAEPMKKARAAATKALELDEGLAEAHTSLALIHENYDWDWAAAEKEYLRAIQLDPNYAIAYQWYGEYLTWRGRFEEALRVSSRARELDPLSLSIAADHGMIYYYSRQYDRAATELNAVLDMDPNFPRAHSRLSEVYVARGQSAQAIADIERCKPLFGMARYWPADGLHLRPFRRHCGSHACAGGIGAFEPSPTCGSRDDGLGLCGNKRQGPHASVAQQSLYSAVQRHDGAQGRTRL
jgi:TolB-like protein/DNA-binding winged helix-turn-helix (wHTH) protein